MKNHTVYIGILIFFFACKSQTTERQVVESNQTKLPNIIYILADDLGYGDLQSYNEASKIPTPHINRLANEGMRFLDAHSPSSVCTPTRYGILTGRYSWRTDLKSGVLRGYGKALIQRDRTTVASILKDKGYQTACIGKWHLGLDWGLKEGLALDAILTENHYDPESIDFNQPVTGGPNDHGFDYSYILPASLDMEPYCYLENQELVTPPTGYTEGNSLNSGYSGPFWRAGRMAPDFDFDQVLPTFTQKAVQYIQQSDTTNPFFLYFPLNGPHTPWLPTDQFKGTSQAGLYGDFVAMVDQVVQQIRQALDAKGVSDHTLIIFTSDNGPFWKSKDVEEYGHHAAGELRGMKADIWEGGHRVPFIAHWPGKIQAGSYSDQTICLTDLMATCAEIASYSLTSDMGEDSYSLMPVFLEQQMEPVRPATIHHSADGMFALRQGDWKFIEARGSGGFSDPKRYNPTPDEPEGQLYNFKTDLMEQNNMYQDYPDRVDAMKSLLQQIQAQGYSVER